MMQAIFLLSCDNQDFRAENDTFTIVTHTGVINHSEKKDEVLNWAQIHGAFINHYQIQLSIIPYTFLDKTDNRLYIYMETIPFVQEIKFTYFLRNFWIKDS